MKISLLFPTCALSLFLAIGCSSTSHKVTGQLHPPISPDAVTVYYKMPAHAEVVGLVSADSFGGADVQQATADAISKLKAQAARLGANGIYVNGLHDDPLSGAKVNAEAIFVAQ